MIVNAKDTTVNLSHSNLPNLSVTIKKWFLQIDFVRVTKTIVDGETQETVSSESFQGVIQNLNSKELQLKEEAQRAWTWKTIHALPDLLLDVDDIFIYNSVNYRVMNVKDFTEYGYIEYHIVKDYE